MIRRIMFIFDWFFEGLVIDILFDGLVGLDRIMLGFVGG